MKFNITLAALLFFSSIATAADYTLHTFTKFRLTNKFWTEAPTIGDIDRDGHIDIVAGPFWYQGPDFKKRTAYYPATETFKLKKADGTVEIVEGFEGGLGTGEIVNNTDSHFAKVVDFNRDQWPDILIVGQHPGHHPSAGSSVAASWYENPGAPALRKGAMWARHLVAENVGNFNLDFVDLFGDGEPVLLGMSLSSPTGDGQAGYFKPDKSDPTLPWTFHAISMKASDYFWFSHGQGYGDVNADGRTDVLIYDGWWEQPASLENDPVWKFHPYPFALGPNQIRQYLGLFDVSPGGVPKQVTVFGGSQMYVDDINSDGLPDIVMSLAAHGYGLAWWEQLKERERNGAPQFKRHMIINSKPSDSKYGVSFSEMQAVAYTDIDGDGLKDIVTGKRWWSHGKCCFDPESDAPAVLYWFKQVRNADKTVEFVPHFIDDDSGAGAQVTVGDVNLDGHPDIVVANKKGAHLFLQKVKTVGREEWEKAQPKATR